jgi:hypothetical protein
VRFRLFRDAARDVSLGVEQHHRIARGQGRADAGNGLQQGVLFAELFGIEPQSDLVVQSVDFQVQEIEMAKPLPQEEAVVVGKAIPI